MEHDDDDFDPLDISAFEARQNTDPVTVEDGIAVTGELENKDQSKLFGFAAINLSRQAGKELKKQRFTEAFARTGNITASCAYAPFSRKTLTYHLEQDPVFKQAFEDAKEIATDALEAQARKMALHGVDEPIIYMGQVVAYRTKYSERMLELLLKAKRRNEFGDKSEVEQTVKGGVMVVPGIVSASDWEASASKQQAEYRGHQEPDA